MQYQMKNFMSTTDSLCEFTFIEGLRDAVGEPLDFFIKKGIKPPYKKWYAYKYPMYRVGSDGTVQSTFSKA